MRSAAGSWVGIGDRKRQPRCLENGQIDDIIADARALGSGELEPREHAAKDR